MHPRVADLIRELELEPHPEGGNFREVFRSSHQVQPLDHRPPRPALTSIYFLLARGQHSRWHRFSSDEVWHFYEGDPLDLFWIDSVRKIHHETLAGPGTVGTQTWPGMAGTQALPGAAGTQALPGAAGTQATSGRGPRPVCVVPAGAWQAARPTGSYALVGCTVGPGFDFDDFELLADDPQAWTEIQRVPGLPAGLL